ncbi:hypothetical protein TNCV_4615531 [Trichonephila clavipes]|nr:hypothetical protein TNCV_4615531 [Trichonephila clavipes]
MDPPRYYPSKLGWNRAKPYCHQHGAQNYGQSDRHNSAPLYHDEFCGPVFDVTVVNAYVLRACAVLEKASDTRPQGETSKSQAAQQAEEEAREKERKARLEG